MNRTWISLSDIAAAQRITLAEAAALAEREHWPKVFRLHDTLVLAPAAPPRRLG